MKMAVFCIVAPCRLPEIYGRFRGACCLLHQTTLRYNPEDSHLQLKYSNLLIRMEFTIAVSTAKAE
jgi:hypothetical protein